MKSSRTLSALGFAGAATVALFACASDPNKEIKEAHDEKRDDQRAYQVTQAELSREQMADQTHLTQGQTDQRVETTNDQQKTMTADDKKIAEANAKMLEERRDVATKAADRINKADAEANEYFNKARALPATKKGYFDGAWSNYSRKRDVAVEKSRLTNDATNEGWGQAKLDIEKSLDELDKSLEELKRTSSP